ncbi:MAG: MerR family DNA-binding transcriptional regulator, partial [Pirellulaceae bacterium]
FIRVKEAAELFGVSTNTLRAWGANGKIPEYRHPVNNYRLYKREEIERIMSQVENSALRVSKRTGQRRKS